MKRVAGAFGAPKSALAFVLSDGLAADEAVVGAVILRHFPYLLYLDLNISSSSCCI